MKDWYFLNAIKKLKCETEILVLHQNSVDFKGTLTRLKVMNTKTNWISYNATPITILIYFPTHSLNQIEPIDQADRKRPGKQNKMLHTSPSLDTEGPLKINNLLMGTCYMLPNSRLKGFKLELLAVVECIFKSPALWKRSSFSLRITEKFPNPAAYNITTPKYMAAPDPMLLVFLPVLIIWI